MDVHLRWINPVNMKIVTDPGIIMEMSDVFTFFAPNYKFHPKVKARVWDGRISLINRMSGQCNVGLAHRIAKFCKERGYTFSFDSEFNHAEITEKHLESFISKLDIPDKYNTRDYQFHSALKCIRSNRRTLTSPTSSGKSLMIYILVRWYMSLGIKPLVIVPTIGLVKQMFGDFQDYGYSGTAHLSTDGLSKSMDIPEEIVITTWQSLESGKRKMPSGWYDQFGMVVGDEAHGCSSKSMINILSAMTKAKYRFGTTGTLAEEPLSEANIIGMFGEIYNTISTKEMIDKGYASKLKIECLVLRYPKEETRIVKELDYHGEITHITNHVGRNNILKKLILGLKGNVLIFFRMTDHGKLIYEMVKEAEPNGNVFYIDGGVDGNTRDEIRKTLETMTDAKLVASLGTTSTGVSVKRLHHMIAASPSKSKIKVMQSIGRMLRLHQEKEESGATLYDIVDDFSSKSYKNYTLNHFIARTKMYDQEGFDYKIRIIEVKP